MTILQRDGALPETTQRFLAGLPRHGDPVGAVWNRLGELERVGNNPTLVDALRAVLLPHQPPRYGHCPACPKTVLAASTLAVRGVVPGAPGVIQPWVGTGSTRHAGVSPVSRGARRE